jgi:nucleotide-binding universal stress UspA family protein
MREMSMTSYKTYVNSSISEDQNSSKTPNVVVCIGEELPTVDLIKHTRFVAEALGGSVVLVQALVPTFSDKTPHDPVEWEIRKREAKSTLTDLSNSAGGTSGVIKTALLEGSIVDQICAYVSHRPQDITAVFRKPAAPGWQAGDSARSVIESDIGSVLMIPMELETSKAKPYKRIIVTLDGSSRAETAIPKAIRLAKAQNAEIILCHVTPALKTGGIRQTSGELKILNEKIASNDRRVGEEYLSRLKSKMMDCGLQVSTCVSGNGDVRRGLLKLTEEQHADIIVIASHGESGHPDVPFGDTANYVMSRSPIPVLMVRQPSRSSRNHVYTDLKSKGVRLATTAMQ